MTARPDPVIHPITRLPICGLLAAGADWVEFAALRDAAGISDSVLSKQSRVLEDAGYAEVRKGAVGRRPRTWFRLTAEGRQALGVTWPGWPSWRRRSPPAPGTCGRRGLSLVIAASRAAYCRLCLAAAELVLTCTASARWPLVAGGLPTVRCGLLALPALTRIDRRRAAWSAFHDRVRKARA